MIINLSPQRRDDTLEVTKLGNKLTVNGELFDFSPMRDGDTLPSSAVASPWFVDSIVKTGGEIEVTMILPLPINYSPEQASPKPLVNMADGKVVFPGPLKVVKGDDA